MRRVAAALVHYPVHDRARAVVTSAITNLDLHDIARSSHTYGLSDLFIVYNDQRVLTPDSPVPGRGLIVKYTHMLAF